MATYESVRYQFTGANIDSASIPSPTIANGSVTNTEFQTVDATSSIQTQLNSKFGAAGGTFTSDVTLADNVDLNVGNGNDLIITSNGTVGFVKGNSITIEDSSGNDMATYTANGAAKLFFGGAQKLETTATGTTIAGTLAAGALQGDGTNITALAAANITSGGTLPSLVGTALTSLNAANLTGTYAALNGGSITSINASNVASGTLANARLPSSISVSNVAGTLSGNGASVTSINGSNISSGTVADARISTLTASKLTGALPAIDGSNLTGIDIAPSTATSVGALKYFAIYYKGSGGASTSITIGVGTEITPSSYESSNMYVTSTGLEYKRSQGTVGANDVGSLGYIMPGFAANFAHITGKTRATETGTWRCISQATYNYYNTSGQQGSTYGVSGGGLFQRVS